MMQMRQSDGNPTLGRNGAYVKIKKKRHLILETYRPVMDLRGQHPHREPPKLAMLSGERLFLHSLAE